MATSNCGLNPTNAWCTCPTLQPYQYKQYNSTTGTFQCCNSLSAPLSNGTQYSDNTSYLYALASEQSTNAVGGACNSFYLSIPNDASMSSNYPELYSIVNINRLISNTFTLTPSLSTNSLTCSEGIPYYLVYDDRQNLGPNVYTICYSGDFPTIPNVNYKIYNVLNVDTGESCASSTCNTQFTESNPYNMNVQVFSSGLFEDNNLFIIARKWWFWVVIIIVFAILIFVVHKAVVINHHKIIQHHRKEIHKSGKIDIRTVDHAANLHHLTH
jgi:hypothetical protein